MADETKPTIYGPDGEVANGMRGVDQLPPGVELPPWLPGIQPGSRTVLAGWWWKLEQAVTNGDGQWALILTPIEPTGQTKRLERETRKVVPLRKTRK